MREARGEGQDPLFRATGGSRGHAPAGLAGDRTQSSASQETSALPLDASLVALQAHLHPRHWVSPLPKSRGHGQAERASRDLHANRPCVFTDRAQPRGLAGSLGLG